MARCSRRWTVLCQCCKQRKHYRTSCIATASVSAVYRVKKQNNTTTLLNSRQESSQQRQLHSTYGRDCIEERTSTGEHTMTGHDNLAFSDAKNTDENNEHHEYNNHQPGQILEDCHAAYTGDNSLAQTPDSALSKNRPAGSISSSLTLSSDLVASVENVQSTMPQHNSQSENNASIIVVSEKQSPRQMASTTLSKQRQHSTKVAESRIKLSHTRSLELSLSERTRGSQVEANTNTSVETLDANTRQRKRSLQTLVALLMNRKVEHNDIPNMQEKNKQKPTERTSQLFAISPKNQHNAARKRSRAKSIFDFRSSVPKDKTSETASAIEPNDPSIAARAKWRVVRHHFDLDTPLSDHWEFLEMMARDFKTIKPPSKRLSTDSVPEDEGASVGNKQDEYQVSVNSDVSERNHGVSDSTLDACTEIDQDSVHSQTPSNAISRASTEPTGDTVEITRL